MDSANILSILATLGQDPSATPVPQPPTNALQAAGVDASQAPPPPPPTFQDPTAQIAQAADAASPPPPKPRRSLLDTIGRISDVLAQVGGAAPLYQPTLNAREDRTTAAADHDLATQRAKLDLATSKFDLSDKQREAANGERERFASVLGAVNDAEDAGNLPAMMAAAGLTDPRYAPFVKMIQANPDVAKTLASALGDGADEKLGHNLYFGTDQSGKTVAYQIGDDGQPHILNFNGITPGEPLKVVNTGGSNVAVGSQTGKTVKILPNTVSPNTVANNAQSDRNNRRTTETQITIAGMPARAKAGAAANSKGAVEDPNIPMYLENIRNGFTSLHNMQALPGEGGAINQLESAIGRTALGQKFGEQAGTAAAQTRLQITKNISQLQQAMLKSLPASATRTRFEQEMLARGLPDPSKMDYKTANTVIDQLYASYQNALKQSQASPPAASAGKASDNLPTLTPEQAAKLPSGARFRTTDGRVLVRQ